MSCPYCRYPNSETYIRILNPPPYLQSKTNTPSQPIQQIDIDEFKKQIIQEITPQLQKQNQKTIQDFSQVTQDQESMIQGLQQTLNQMKESFDKHEKKQQKQMQCIKDIQDEIQKQQILFLEQFKKQSTKIEEQQLKSQQQIQEKLKELQKISREQKSQQQETILQLCQELISAHFQELNNNLQQQSKAADVKILEVTNYYQNLAESLHTALNDNVLLYNEVTNLKRSFASVESVSRSASNQVTSMQRSQSIQSQQQQEDVDVRQSDNSQQVSSPQDQRSQQQSRHSYKSPQFQQPGSSPSVSLLSEQPQIIQYINTHLVREPLKRSASPQRQEIKEKLAGRLMDAGLQTSAIKQMQQSQQVQTSQVGSNQRSVQPTPLRFVEQSAQAAESPISFVHQEQVTESSNQIADNSRRAGFESKQFEQNFAANQLQMHNYYQSENPASQIQSQQVRSYVSSLGRQNLEDRSREQQSDNNIDSSMQTSNYQGRSDGVNQLTLSQEASQHQQMLIQSLTGRKQLINQLPDSQNSISVAYRQNYAPIQASQSVFLNYQQNSVPYQQQVVTEVPQYISQHSSTKYQENVLQPQSNRSQQSQQISNQQQKIQQVASLSARTVSQPSTVEHISSEPLYNQDRLVSASHQQSSSNQQPPCPESQPVQFSESTQQVTQRSQNYSVQMPSSQQQQVQIIQDLPSRPPKPEHQAQPQQEPQRNEFAAFIQDQQKLHSSIASLDGEQRPIVQPEHLKYSTIEQKLQQKQVRMQNSEVLTAAAFDLSRQNAPNVYQTGVTPSLLQRTVVPFNASEISKFQNQLISKVDSAFNDLKVARSANDSIHFSEYEAKDGRDSLKSESQQ